MKDANQGGHCLVTGGAGALGAATARLAAKAGQNVSIVSLEHERNAANELVAEIEGYGANAVFIAADVSVEKDIVVAYEQAAQTFGAPTGAVHAAGVFVGSKVADLNFVELSKLMAVNVTGLMICCREAVRLMSSSKGGQGGSIVNISSMATTIGGRPGHSAYAASKGAVDVFTQGFAKEVALEDIRVNSIRPGAFVSEMTAALDANPEAKKTVEASIPMGRLGLPEELAEIAMWLMSPAASLVTGAAIDASGGGFHVAGSV